MAATRASSPRPMIGFLYVRDDRRCTPRGDPDERGVEHVHQQEEEDRDAGDAVQDPRPHALVPAVDRAGGRLRQRRGASAPWRAASVTPSLLAASCRARASVGARRSYVRRRAALRRRVASPAGGKSESRRPGRRGRSRASLQSTGMTDAERMRWARPRHRARGGRALLHRDPGRRHRLAALAAVPRGRPEVPARPDRVGADAAAGHLGPARPDLRRRPDHGRHRPRAPRRRRGAAARAAGPQRRARERGARTPPPRSASPPRSSSGASRA